MQACIEIVEYLRNKMIETAVKRSNLTHPDVVSVSQQLDLFILQTQELRSGDHGAEELSQEYRSQEMGLWHLAQGKYENWRAT